MLDLNGKKVIVTGGCGFIGSNFINLLFENYTDLMIINFDKMGKGSREIPSRKGLKNHSIDIREYDLINNLLENRYKDIKIDYVFHFAAESHVDRSINSPVEFVENNVIGTVCLLESMKKYQPQAKIIHVSTDEVYGHLELDDEPFTEKSNLAPRSPYSASKASSDLIALSYHETYGMDILVTRCCNNFGPWQDSEKFIPTVLKSLMNENAIPVYGNGTNVREWIFVDDHNKSILEIAETGTAGNVYNIGSGVEKNNLEIIQDIINAYFNEKCEIEEFIQFVTDRKGHDFRYAISSLNYNREFELETFENGLKKTISHYLNGDDLIDSKI